jgi:hypothetical protein
MNRRTILAALASAAPMMAADDPTAVSVGTGRTGQTAWQFIGTINQTGADMTMSGYLTAIAGLTEAQLYHDPNIRSADTAQFKFTATGKMTVRNAAPPLFVLNSVATTTISVSPGGLFSSSSNIATLDSNLQTVVDVTAPARGQLSGSGDYVRTSAANFVIAGVTYRFGESNRVLHLTMSGDGMLTDPAGPVSTIVVAGRAVIGDYLPQQ